jgi:nucleoside-diphosphate-sugar epimerase
MKVFITGATGFIGANLAMKMAGEGIIVHAIYRTKNKTDKIQHGNLIWFLGDILDVASLKIAMTGCSQVYHIAAYASAWEQHPGDFAKFNVQGTINVLKAAQEISINKIVITSTAGVFGPSLNGTITEDTVTAIRHFTGYERSKAEAERIISDYAKQGMSIVVVNPTRVFGPGPLNESNSVTKIIKMYAEGKWRIVPGNGESIGNYVFVDDVVNGHILAMEKGKTGEKYILGGESITYNAFYNKLEKSSGKHFKLFHLPPCIMMSVARLLILLNKLFGIRPPITPALVRKFNYNWEVSSDKAANELGYRFMSFDSGLLKTYEWLSKKSFL